MDSGQWERCGMVPVFTVNRSISPASSFAPAASPRLRRRPSPWPPARPLQPGAGVDHPPSGEDAWSRATDRPLSTRFEPVRPLRDFDHWFTCVAPSDLARRTRIVWSCRYVPPLSGLLPALSVVPRIRLPPASNEPLRRFAGGVLSPPHGQVAPRGARSGRRTRQAPGAGCGCRVPCHGL